MIRMERRIEVIGMPAVRVIVEREVAMPVGVIAVIAVRVAVRVLMSGAIGMIGMRPRIRMWSIGVRRCIGMRRVGVRSVGMVIVWRIGMRRGVRMRCVHMIGVIIVRWHHRIQMDVQVLDDVVPVP